MNIRSNVTENYIIEILANRYKSNVQEIHHIIKEKYQHNISLPQLYRIVKKMAEEYIIVKQHGFIQLNAIRIKHINSFVGSLASSFDHIINKATLPETSKYYEAKSLLELEQIRVDVSVKVVDSQNIDTFYTYDTHLYYLLGMFDISESFYKLYPTKTIYNVVGSDSTLDQYTKELTKHINIRLCPQILLPKNNYSCRVFGEYLIEIRIPDSLAPFFKQMYEIEDITQFNIDTFKSLFKMNTNCKLRITKNKKRCDHIASIIKTAYLKNKRVLDK